jgi:hypothetical protein
VGGFVFAADDGEGVHDVGDVLAFDAVEVEVGGVQFAAEEEAALFVPAEGGAVVAAILGEGAQVVGGVGEFEDAGEEEGAFIILQRDFAIISIRRATLTMRKISGVMASLIITHNFKRSMGIELRLL